MTLKEFLEQFDHANPDWSQTPEGWPECDLSGLSSDEVGKCNAVKASWGLSRPQQPEQKSRTWNDPEGYTWLVPWSNALLLRILVRKFTDSLSKSEYRRKAQVDDAVRSVVRNIEEGYKRATTSEYIDLIPHHAVSAAGYH